MAFVRLAGLGRRLGLVDQAGRRRRPADPRRLGKRFGADGFVIAVRARRGDRDRLRKRGLERYPGIVGSLAGAVRAVAVRARRHAAGGRPIADRDPEVIGVDLAKGEKAVAIPAVFDKGRLQRRLDARHLGQIDVAFYLLLCRRFEIELFETIAVEHHHPGLFRMCGIDEHALCHSGVTPGRAAAAARNSAGGAIPWVRKPATPELMPSGNDWISATANLVRGRPRVRTIRVARRSVPARRHKPPIMRAGRAISGRARRPTGGRRFFANTNVYW